MELTNNNCYFFLYQTLAPTFLLQPQPLPRKQTVSKGLTGDTIHRTKQNILNQGIYFSQKTIIYIYLFQISISDKILGSLISLISNNNIFPISYINSVHVSNTFCATATNFTVFFFFFYDYIYKAEIILATRYHIICERKPNFLVFE